MIRLLLLSISYVQDENQNTFRTKFMFLPVGMQDFKFYDTFAPVFPRLLVSSRTMFNSSIVPVAVTSSSSSSDQSNWLSPAILPHHSRAKAIANIQSQFRLLATSATLQFTPKMRLTDPHFSSEKSFDLFFRRVFFFPYFRRSLVRLECDFVTDENAPMIAQISALQQLIIHGRRQSGKSSGVSPSTFTFVGFKTFASLVELTELRIENSATFATDPATLQQGRQDLLRREIIFTEGLSRLFGDTMDALTTTEESQSTRLDDFKQKPLRFCDTLRSMSRLRAFGVVACPSVTPDAFEGLFESNPRLECFSITYNNHFITSRDPFSFLKPFLHRSSTNSSFYRNNTNDAVLLSGLRELSIGNTTYSGLSEHLQLLWEGTSERETCFDLIKFEGAAIFTKLSQLELFRCCPHLEVLDISMCSHQFPDYSLSPLCIVSAFEPLFGTNLRKLHLSPRFVDEQEGDDCHLIELMNHLGHRLEDVKFPRCSVTNAVIRALIHAQNKNSNNNGISSSRRNLRILDISYNILLSPIIYRWIGECESIASSLEEFNIMGCSGLNKVSDPPFIYYENDENGSNEAIVETGDEIKYLKKCRKLRSENILMALKRLPK